MSASPAPVPADAAVLRVPPHDADAELMLIGGWMLLFDEPAEIRRSRVEPTDFYSSHRGLVARALLSCVDDGIPIDPATVLHRIRALAGDDEHAQQLQKLLTQAAALTTSPAHVRGYAATVQRTAALRRLLGACTAAQAAVLEPGADPEAIAQNLAASAAEANQATAVPLSGKASDLIPDALHDIVTPYSREGHDGRISWGVRELDLAGCFVRPGSFPIVAARPGSGKTTFLRRWAFRTANLTGRPVIYCTLEQEPKELLIDELLAEAGVKDPCGQGIQSGEDSDRLLSAARFLDSVLFYAPSAFPHRLLPLVAWLHQVIAANRPAAVVIDYLTKVIANGRDANERASLISSRLRSVALQTGCPIVCAAQLNRASAGDRREPDLHDLRDSGQIEQDATSVIMLHYPWAQATREERHRGLAVEGELTLLVRKNRHGKSFTRMQMHFEGAYKRILAAETARA